MMCANYLRDISIINYWKDTHPRLPLKRLEELCKVATLRSIHVAVLMTINLTVSGNATPRNMVMKRLMRFIPPTVTVT
jgi:hypothetical protein